MLGNPYQKYQQQSVMTMTQGEMLTKLYDEAIKQLSGAKLFIQEREVENANRALQRAQRILNYLKSTLDFHYEVSKNLNALYDYFIRRIVQANLRKETEPLDEIIPMISELRETFMKADRVSRAGNAS